MNETLNNSINRNNIVMTLAVIQESISKTYPSPYSTIANAQLDTVISTLIIAPIKETNNHE